MLAQAAPDVRQVAWRAVQQATVTGIGEGIGVAGIAEQVVEGGEVGGQGAQRAQQGTPGRVVLTA
ncbi:hypothetical protein D3C87_2022040 [compost metagenome]